MAPIRLVGVVAPKCYHTVQHEPAPREVPVHSSSEFRNSPEAEFVGLHEETELVGYAAQGRHMLDDTR